jgi:hypothetical protein
MTSIDESPAVSITPVATVAPASLVEDAVMALFGTALVVGAATDGWAHNTLLQQIQQEGFFTPWHGLIYAAFAGSAAWTVFLAYRRRHAAAEWWRDGWPAGYRVGALGLVVFLLAGGGDAVWHTVFGIEANVAALLSPSHLCLAVGSGMFLTSPFRSWLAQGAGAGWRAATGVWSLAVATASAAIFFSYASAFYPARPTQPYDGGPLGTPGFTNAALGLGGYVITAAVLAVPLLLVHRRRAVPGTATALVFTVALFAVAIREFPGTETAGAVAAVLAAAAVDGLLYWLDQRRGSDAPLRLPIAGALFASIVWAAHLLALQLAKGVQWAPELTFGTIVTVAGVGAVLGGLATRPLPAGELSRR